MAYLAPVIPFDRRRQNRLAAVAEPRMPEPAQLYSLICLAFVLHVPDTASGACQQCQQQWPCDHVRLAYRLREGF